MRRAASTAIRLQREVARLSHLLDRLKLLRVVEAFPSYDDARERATTREIPVVCLRPVVT
jgi:uncharacterized protein (DUF934 family)